jgi:Na+-transporting NADH:ubiquinone oxidoreductase subunit A
MADIIRIKKGLDIPLNGGVSDTATVEIKATKVGVVPDDYPGMGWKAVVKAGDEVVKGSPLLVDKESAKIKIVSPIAGVVEEIRRGDRRKIEAVVVKSSKVSLSPITYSVTAADNEQIISLLCETGLWAMMRQRPYDVVPRTDVVPRDIFITTFDSAPLAPDIITVADKHPLEMGVKVLKRLTSGNVYLGMRFGSGVNVPGVEVVEIQGPHPAGNVGVQIANIKPVNKGETVWALDARTVVRIGRLFDNATLDMDAEIAVTGPEVAKPVMAKSSVGAAIGSLLKDNLKRTEHHQRVISGNVLTGYKVNPETDFLRYPYRHISVIEEGDDHEEFMGWASVSPKRFSVKHSFPAFLRGLKKPFDFDARIKGGRRAMIVSGEYDKVFPMDIYPEYLLKAIITKDIDKMEKLGIYEVAPEDFALAEFVDTSKINIQQIVREGLAYLRKELE